MSKLKIQIYFTEYIQRAKPGEYTTWEACSDIQVLDNIDKAHKSGGEIQNIPWKLSKVFPKFSLVITGNNISTNYNLISRIHQQKEQEIQPE